MRPQKVQDTEILQGLMSVFRSKGYDGASLNELAKATGLKKASLYHRFPNGKKEMTSSVLTYLESWIKKEIYEVLVNERMDTEERLTLAVENIRQIYQGGEKICMYRSLSMDTGIALFGEQIKEGINQWLAGFIKIGIALNMSQAQAEKNANQTFIDIQGSLVLSKAMGTTKPFYKTLEQIKKRYAK